MSENGYILAFSHWAKELATATGKPVNSLLVELNDGAELFLVFKQQRHIDVDVLRRSVMPLELRHHSAVHLRLNRLPNHWNKLFHVRESIWSKNLVEIKTFSCNGQWTWWFLFQCTVELLNSKSNTARCLCFSRVLRLHTESIYCFVFCYIT